jgi:heptosyltransferase III
VVRGGAIGDFILTLPALAALRRQFLRARIEVLGYPQVASLAKLAGYAHAVRSIEARPLAGFFARHGDLDKGLSEYFSGFSIIISYLYDPDEIFRDNIARCSKAQFIAGPHRPNEAENVHATEVFLKPLERLAIFNADPVPRLNTTRANRQNASALLAVHPGSGSDRKNWPEEHWQELLGRVAAETRWRVLIVGGEAEEARLQRLSSLIPIERLKVALRQPLAEVAGRLALCDAFVGHDSGITHLAAAVGVHGLALWAETNPNIWRPLADQFELLSNEQGVAYIASDCVFEKVAGLMQCSTSNENSC